MDFARRQLEKYGWTDGKGLGKNENGISEALKPKLKRSVAGVGHDPAADFTEHWWETLYDKAAGNLQIEEKNGKTKKIKTKEDGEFEITNSTWQLKKKKKKKNSQEKKEYGNYFVKTEVMSVGSKTKKVKESDSEDEEHIKTDGFKMTDEELFAACEGRTAHKGARHGLKALGKLARIEEQERLLLAQTKYEEYSTSKKWKNKNLSVNDLQTVENINLNSDEDTHVIKKNKKKRCQTFESNSEQVIEDKNVVSLNCIEETKKKKKKRCKNLDSEDKDSIHYEHNEESVISQKKKNIDESSIYFTDVASKKKNNDVNKKRKVSQESNTCVKPKKSMKKCHEELE